jgi:hypothetical protein
MASFTAHYGLQQLFGGDNFGLNGQKYTLADRAQIDQLLFIGAQGHQHTGASASDIDPTTAGTVVSSTTGGSIAAGTTLSYEYTLVDSTGAESLPSPPVTITLAAGTQAPANPTVTPTPGTGTLALGDYYYALSAYTTTTTNETTANATGYAYLSAIGEMVITFPTLPSGATGFNIYRKAFNELNFMYLDSSTGSTYTDDGSVTPSCTRTLPSTNYTNSTNSVTFTLPEAVPTGYTWNLYRTTSPGQFTGSLLANVIETVSDTSSVVVTDYVDVGNGNLNGSPPLVSQIIGSPSKINLATETTGTLPASSVGGFPFVVTFAFPGNLSPTTGTSVWTSDFETAQIVSVRASLGRGSSPSSVPVEVDVVKGSGATPSYTTIFPSGPVPQVPVGDQIGTAQAPPSTVTLNPGDSLSVDLTQVGGGATPTDHDLTVNVYMLAAVSGSIDSGGGGTDSGGGGTDMVTYVDSSSVAQPGESDTVSVIIPSDTASGNTILLGVSVLTNDPSMEITLSDTSFTLVTSEVYGAAYIHMFVYSKTAGSGDSGATLTVTTTAPTSGDASYMLGACVGVYSAATVGPYGASIVTGNSNAGPTVVTTSTSTMVTFSTTSSATFTYDGTFRQSAYAADFANYVLLEDYTQTSAGSYTSDITGTATGAWVTVTVALS